MRKRKIALPLLAAILTLPSCTSVNDALTPGLSVSNDQFTESKNVSQPPVGAASGLGEAWNTLGFEWTATQPNLVIITIGVHGVANVNNVEFNVDGNIISGLQPVNSVTDYDSIYSTRTFVMSFAQFKQVATASIVKMKVDGDTSSGVSSFGTSTSGSMVQTKFAPFLASVSQIRGS